MSNNFNNFDNQVKLEIYLSNQKKSLQSEFDSYEGLILLLIDILKKTNSMIAVRKRLETFRFSKDFEMKLLKAFNSQKDIITKKYDVNKIPSLTIKALLLKEAYEGLDFKSVFELRKDNLKKKALKFVYNVRPDIENNKSIDYLLKKEILTNIDYQNDFFDNNLKIMRNYIYTEVDKDLAIEGWQSIAILDKRTSAICQSLHGKFYSYKEYKSRLDIPNIPPRHPNCRSQIITIEKGVPINTYLKEDLNTFFNRNPKDAKAMLGKEKYKLWKESGKNASELYDRKNMKLYTNKQLKKKLNIL